MTGTSSRIVYINGQFVPESAARVSIYDSGLVMGDMAYEVTRTFSHRPFRLRDHLERLAHTLSVLRIELPMPLHTLEQITLETLGMNLSTEPSDVDWNIIHNVSRGPSSPFLDAFPEAERQATVTVSCYPLSYRLGKLAPLFSTGIDLVVPQQRAVPREVIDPTIKTRSRWYFQLANMQAEALHSGAWAVLMRPDGILTEGTNANLFLVRGGEIFTPHESDVLSGITRDVVIELAAKLGLRLHEADLTVDDALSADEVFLTSTSIGALHARSFDRIAIGDGQLGPVTAKIRAAIEREVGIDFAAQAQAYAARQG